MAALGSTAESAIASLVIPEGADISVDKINGAALSSQYINDGKTPIYYEWQEENGLLLGGSSDPSQAQGNSVEPENFAERYLLTLDSTQAVVNIDVVYRYVNDEYRLNSGKNGTFPRVYLLSPEHIVTTFIENESKTNGQNNGEDYAYLKVNVEGPVAGE